MTLPCSLINSGTCINGGICLDDFKGGFSCKCMIGFTGEKCEIGKFTKINLNQSRVVTLK
jgi:hypothetical protein